MAPTAPADVWAEGAAYERYIGRWSRLVAREFLAWLAPAPGARWLDVGCGSGALSQAIGERCAPARVIALDRSEAFVRHARAAQGSGTDVVVADALALPVRAGAVDMAVSGLMLNFVSAPAGALAELRRAVRSAGTVAVYVWDYAGRMEVLRNFWDAATALDAAVAGLDEGKRFPICRPEPLRALFVQAGFAQIDVAPVDVPTRFTDFDDCWRPFLGGQGPAPGYVASLSAVRQAALREAFRARSPIAADGSIELTARAWAARGVV